MNRNTFSSEQLTLARHPSETDKRMMIRLMAFALHASDRLAFTRGISSDDEPDLWQKNLHDEIELWIELGLPDSKRIKKASNRARQVFIYSYGGRAADSWWQQHKSAVSELNNVNVINVNDDDVADIIKMVERNMEITCTIDGDTLFMNDTQHAQVIRFQPWLKCND